MFDTGKVDIGVGGGWGSSKRAVLAGQDDRTNNILPIQLTRRTP